MAAKQVITDTTKWLGRITSSSQIQVHDSKADYNLLRESSDGRQSPESGLDIGDFPKKKTISIATLFFSAKGFSSALHSWESARSHGQLYPNFASPYLALAVGALLRKPFPWVVYSHHLRLDGCHPSA